MAVEIVKVTRKGQVTIPQDIREKLEVSEGDYLAVTKSGKHVLMRKAELPSWDKIFAEGRKLAREKGITRADVLRACAEVRRG
ncbi:MAG: AbrB/MazE/SpoVT family DNA-binding domain-containing protein [Candidatus Hadarchaeota archaeon]|nr:AbrB/MazE/SpoVT family DNA-binding domain-containing protein [Candidatus Hadarchaeota archaeon]